MKNKYLSSIKKIVISGFIFASVIPLSANIKIAAWNIQNYGSTKAGRSSVVNLIATTINQYDIVVVQEFGTGSGGACGALTTPEACVILTELNVVSGGEWSITAGDDAGTGGFAEKSGVAYWRNTRIASVTNDGLATTTGTVMQRPPGRFTATILGSGETFQLFSVHTSPTGGVQAEITTGIPGYLNNSATDPEVIVLGDFNGDTCNGYYDLTWNTYAGNITSPHTAPGAIANGADSNVNTSSCTYDRMTFSNALGNWFTGNSGVDYFDGPAHNCAGGQMAQVEAQCLAQGWGNCTCQGGTTGLQTKISDHYPVWMELSIGGIDFPPTVAATNPANGAPGVAWNSNSVSITFSEAMNTASFSATTISINNGATITGSPTFSNFNKTATFPVTLPTVATTHTVSVSSSASSPTPPKDSTNNALVNDYTFSFTTADPSTVSPNVVISEVGNSIGGTEGDYIELYNPTGSDVNLNGYAIHRDVRCSFYYGSWAESLTLSGTLPAGKYYLIGRGTNPFQADRLWAGSGSIGTSDCLALTTDTTPPTSWNAANVSDFVSFSSSDDVASPSTFDTSIQGEGNTYASPLTQAVVASSVKGTLGTGTATKRAGTCKQTDNNNNMSDYFTQGIPEHKNLQAAPCGVAGAGFTIVQTAGSSTVDETGPTSDSYSIVLDSQPTGDVVITVSWDGAQVTSDTATLTFTSTNWATPQTVTITAVDDVNIEGYHTTDVTHTAASTDSLYNGGTVPSVNYIITDNDSAAISSIVIAEIGDKLGGLTANDFVLLHNPTAAAIDINGWYIGRDSGCSITGGSWTEYKKISVAGGSTNGTSIPSGGYYLIGRAGAVAPMPALDFTWNGSVANGNCIVLANSSTKPTAWNSPNVIDFVDTGTGGTFGEGNTASPSLSAGISVKRSGTCKSNDTNINSTDLVQDFAPAPQNSASATCVAPDTTPPTVVLRETKDLNGNGQVDAIRIQFSEAINDATLQASDFTISNGFGTPTGSTSGATLNDMEIFLYVTESGTSDTGVIPTVAYSQSGATDVADTSGNKLANFAAISSVDRALPVLLSATGSVGGTALSLTFSEPVDTDGPPLNANLSGPGDFFYTDTSTGDAASIAGITDNDGTNSNAVLTVNLPFVGSDFNADTVSARSGQVKDASSNNMAFNHVIITTVPGIFVSTISGPTTESGTTATFNVALTTTPTANVTIGISSGDLTEGTVSSASLTFTVANWATNQTVTVTGVDDTIVDGNITYNIITAAAVSADGNYNNVNPADVSVTNNDNDIFNINVSSASNNVGETGTTATFTINLSGQPTSNVTIGLSSSDTSEGTISPSSLVFTSLNFASTQSVTITGVNDNIADGDITYSIITAPAVSTDTNYNNLNAIDVAITTTDDDFVSVAVSSTGGITTEAGGNATFTIVLGSQPTSDVSLNISSSDTSEATASPPSVLFTSANWNAPQTITVTGVDDLIDDGNINYMVILSATSSSASQYNGINPADLTFSNTDNDTLGIAVSSTGGVTTEAGATHVFTIVLSSQPTSDVSIGISSSDTSEGMVAPSSVTFTSANWNSTQNVTITGIDDFVADGNIAYNIILAPSSSSASQYNGINPADLAMSNTDNDVVGISLSSTNGITTEAGGTSAFTIVLNSQPTSNVSIPLSSNDTTEGTVLPASLNFTPANWSSAQTVTVTGVDDIVTDGDISYLVVTAAAASTDSSYNNFNALDYNVVNTDNDVASINVSAISGNTSEAGGTATFTVVLGAQPTSDVTLGLSSSDTSEGTVSPSSLTFTVANWNSAQTVTVTGVDDFVADGNINYNIITAAAVSATGVFNGLNAADVTVINNDNDAVGFNLSAVSGPTSEAGTTATFTVALASQPTSSVTIALASSDTSEGTVSPASLTFTAGNWNSPQTATATGVDDAVADGNISYSIITAPATSSDPGYNGLNASDAIFVNNDNDVVGISLSSTSGVTTEAGGTATFTIVLSSQPTADVTIGLSSSDTSEGTPSPASVTFTSANWNSAQTITITGVDDLIADGNILYSIITAASVSSDPGYNGINPANYSATNTDNDIAGITVSTISGNTSEAGTTATFTIKLNTQPTDNVTINVYSNDTTEGSILPASVTFTPANWNSNQTLTVTGVDDAIVDGNINFNIITQPASSTDSVYNGINANDVAVTNNDNDAASINVSVISGNTTEAGATATFTVVLGAQPTSDVTIGLSSSDTSEGTASPLSLIFTVANWNSAQTVTVTGVDDFVADGNISYNIITAAAVSATAAFSGLNAADVTVINNDNDAVGFNLSAVSGPTSETGTTSTFTIALASQPTSSVTIGLSSSDTSEGTVSPSSLTFTAGNWNSPQTVTATGVDDFVTDGNISYSIITAPATSSDPGYNGQNASDAIFVNNDNDVVGISLSSTSGITTEAGGTATFTIVLSSQPTADVTIGLSSSDTSEGTVSPTNLTFTSANWNSAQTITITGVDDFIADGNILYSIITAASVSSDPGYNGINPANYSATNTDNDTAGITVSTISGNTSEAGTTATFTIKLNTQPTDNVTIDVFSDDTTEGTILPISVTFTPANWNSNQTLTVTGVDDAIVDGNINFNIVTQPASSTDSVYNGFNGNDVAVTNNDNDAVGFSVSTISGNTSEAGTTATFTISLNSQPTANVVINLSSSDSSEGTISPTSLTFTNGNWNSNQTVTVTGVDDFIDDGNISYNIITLPATSSDSGYNGQNPTDINVLNIDNDAVGIVVSTISTNTTEAGGTATFTVKLASQPTSNVTIALSSSDTSEGSIFPTSLTFTAGNWNSNQTATVTGVDDSIVDGNVAFNIITAPSVSSDPGYSGVNGNDIAVINNDNDSAGFSISAISGNTTEAGGTATFTIKLTSMSSANVTINLASSDTSEGTVSPTSVTFTSGNWNTNQTVTVTGVDDLIADGNITYSIITAAAISADGNYNGLNPTNVSVINADNDAPGISVSLISGNTSEAGTTATFTVVLNTLPTANVSINLSSSDTSEGTISPTSLTFNTANWNSPQTVTVTGVNDNVDDGDKTFNIITANAVSTDGNYNNLASSDVSVINIDDDTAAINLSAVSGNTSETGTTATFTIVLASQPTSSVTIGLSSSDTSEATVAPASVTFSTANWNSPQTITATGVDDFVADGNISYTIISSPATSADPGYSSMNASDASLTNTDNDTVGFSVSVISGDTGESSTSATFTIKLNSQPTANVTIGLASSDTSEGTISPTSITFTTANWNSNQTVTVTGVDDNIADGNIVYSIITNAAVSSDAGYSGQNPSNISVTNIDNDSSGIIVSAISGNTTEAGGTATFTIRLNSQPVSGVSINLSSSDTSEGTVSPSNISFTSSDWSINQTVTVTGVDDAIVDGSIAYTIITSNAVSLDSGYSNLVASNVSTNNLDNDAVGFTLSAISGPTNETGTTATFTMKLNSQPTANVTIGLSSADTSEGSVSPTSVTFTASNWNSNQTVTITGVDDFLVDGNKTYNIVTAAGVSSDGNYSGQNPSDISVTNVDNDAVGFTLSAISGATSEAGTTATFTLKLNSQPTANVTIALSSSDTSEGSISPTSFVFTPLNWNSNQTATVTGVDDFIVDGNINYSVITSSAVSTDTNYSGQNPNDVAITNNDNDTSGFNISAISGNTSETGTTATFTIKLTSQPTSNVTIGLSSSDTSEVTISPTSVTFTSSNWNNNQTVTATGVDDFIDDGNITVSIVTAAAVSSDGNYSTQNPSDVSVTNNDNDSASISVSTISGNTSEAGATATFGVRLNSQPVADVTFSLTSNDLTEGTVAPSSLAFTSLNWSTTQNVTVTGVDDVLTDGNQTYSIITGNALSADSVYNNLVIADVSVINIDNDSATAIVSAISGNTSETGTTATFTIKLSSQPTADVTIGLSSSDTSEGTVSPSSVTFTNANWNSNQTVTVTGVDDAVVDGPINYNIITSAMVSSDSNFNGVNPSDVSATNNDNDVVGFTLSAISGATSEAGTTATFTLKLNSQPTANVTIGLSSSDTSEGSISPTSFVFTPLNWNSNQTATVTGVDDFIVDGNISYSIVTSAAVSTDANYSGQNPNDVTVTNNDNDTSGFNISAISGNTSETGTTATFTIKLTSQPTSNVTIGLSSSDTSEDTVSPTSVTFTTANWNNNQTVTVTGVDDAIDDGNSTINIVTAPVVSSDGNYSAQNPSDVSVTNNDNDTANITVTTISGNTSESGTTATFGVRLNSQPVADVTFSITSNDLTEGTVAPSSLAFTSLNWSTTQSVTVTGVDDVIADGNQTFSIITGNALSIDGKYNNMVIADVSVTNNDNDTANATISLISGNTTEGGGTATFTVKLSSQPTSNVTINLSSSDTSEGTVAPSSVTFTNVNWNNNQTVTVTGVDDALIDGNIAYTIISAPMISSDANFNGVNPADVNVTNNDNDSAGISASAISGNTSETGTTATFTIVLNTAPAGNVTVGLSSSDTSEGTVSPSSVTFTTTNWNAPQTVTATGVDDAIVDGSVAYSIITLAATSTDSNYNGVNANDVSLNNTDNDSVGATLSVASGPTTEGGATATFTIRLNTMPSANVTIGLASSDTSEGSVSPTNVTFTSLNWSSTQSVTVTGVDDLIDDGNISYSIITLPASSSDSNYNGFNAANVSFINNDNDTAAVNVSTISGDTSEAGTTATFGVSLKTQPTSNVQIIISSGDATEGTVAPSILTFTNVNWSSTQSVTVTGVDDILVDGTITYSIVTSAAVSADSKYSGLAVADVTVKNIDNDSATINISAISGNTSETGTTATFTVVLGTQASSDVILGFSSSDTTEGTVSPTSVTFTNANWNSARIITVTGVDDAMVDGAISYTIISAPAASSDSAYNGTNPSDVNVTNNDNDTVGATLSAISGNTSETGSSATFTIKLTSQPSANVTIGIASSDTSEGTVSPSSFIFTNANWNSNQTATVTGVDDVLADGNIVYSVTTLPATSTDANYNNYNAADVSVTNTDNESADVSAPFVQAVYTTASDGVYLPGDSLQIVVNFNEPISITGGALRLVMNTGAIVDISTPNSSTQDTNWIGTYTITTGQIASKLDVIAFSIPSSVQVKDIAGNLLNISSMPLANISTTSNIEIAKVIVKVTDFRTLIVAPNPYELKSGQSKLIFQNIPDKTSITIFSAIGAKIKEFKAKTVGDVFTLNMSSAIGARLSDGLYLLVLKAPNGKRKVIKFLVRR